MLSDEPACGPVLVAVRADALGIAEPPGTSSVEPGPEPASDVLPNAAEPPGASARAPYGELVWPLLLPARVIPSPKTNSS